MKRGMQAFKEMPYKTYWDIMKNIALKNIALFSELKVKITSVAHISSSWRGICSAAQWKISGEIQVGFKKSFALQKTE